MKIWIFVGLAVLFLFQLAVHAAVVSDLTVTDYPGDDGTGLILAWTPLPPSDRIIEYRIYRGVSQDTLFYIGKIDVNPQLDLTKNKLFYYDRDFNDFVSVFSPARLSQEIQQPPGSPIYRSIPRDIDVYGELLRSYYVLGVIDKKEFYYKAVNHIDKEGNSFASLKLRQFEGLYSSLVPGISYYYSIISVDEQRRFNPYSEIVSATPIDNPPEAIQNFSVVLVNDDRLQFEWDSPAFRDDIFSHNVYIISKDNINDFYDYLNILNEYQSEAQMLQSDPGLDSHVQDIPQNPAVLIDVTPSSFPYMSSTVSWIELSDGMIANEDYGLFYEISTEEINDYLFIFSLKDYSGFETFGEPTKARVKDFSVLPDLPIFTVQDKKNDQGDYNDITFGKPIVFLTNAGFTNRRRNRLIVNYDYSENREYKISRMYFDFYDINGKLIDSVTEYYFDNVLYLNIDHEHMAHDGIYAHIRYDVKRNTIEHPYQIRQNFFYDPSFQLFIMGDLFVNEENLSDFNYILFKRSKAEKNFRLVRQISPFVRLFEDNIPYETSIFKMVGNYDSSTGSLLVDSTIDITYDEVSGQTLYTNIFIEEIEKNATFYRDHILGLKDSLDGASSDEKQMIQDEIDYYNIRLDLFLNHPILKEANSFNENRSRMNFLRRVREEHRRSFEYYMVKSYGDAVFSVSEVYERNGKSFFIPQPDWFNTDKYPMLIASLIFGLLVFWLIKKAQQGREMFVRPIAGIEEIDNAIGRATEMGKPILFVPGLSTIDDIATLAGLQILGHVARRAAEYDTRIMVPVCDYIVLPIAMEIVKEAHYSAGRIDTYNKEDIFFIAEGQFAYVAGVNGIMLRQKTATNFYMGVFFAEALIMTETGNINGSIQIAGSDALTQIPFFITTCDYTLIGEELYGASAYLSRDPFIMGTLKAQDYAKALIVFFIITGTVLSSLRITFLINFFPSQ